MKTTFDVWSYVTVRTHVTGILTLNEFWMKKWSFCKKRRFGGEGCSWSGGSQAIDQADEGKSPTFMCRCITPFRGCESVRRQTVKYMFVLENDLIMGAMFKLCSVSIVCFVQWLSKVLLRQLWLPLWDAHEIFNTAILYASDVCIGWLIFLAISQVCAHVKGRKRY